MPIICPSILASDEEEYKKQIEKVASFAHRIQIDLTDGKFAPKQTVTPDQVWWPVGIRADFHLMYDDPLPAVKEVLQYEVNLIIVHAEARGNFETLAHLCRSHNVKVGVAILPKTHPKEILGALRLIDHVLLFSGTLGEYGGHADLDLLKRVHTLKDHKPDIEVGWDGGINQQNISQLAAGGVDVFDVGGAIQESADPQRTFHALQRIADETGTT